MAPDYPISVGDLPCRYYEQKDKKKVSDRACWYCDQKGHLKFECPKYLAAKAKKEKEVTLCISTPTKPDPLDSSLCLPCDTNGFKGRTFAEVVGDSNGRLWGATSWGV